MAEPAQTNVLYYGDNLDILHTAPTQRVPWSFELKEHNGKKHCPSAADNWTR